MYPAIIPSTVRLRDQFHREGGAGFSATSPSAHCLIPWRIVGQEMVWGPSNRTSMSPSYYRHAFPAQPQNSLNCNSGVCFQAQVPRPGVRDTVVPLASASTSPSSPWSAGPLAHHPNKEKYQTVMLRDQRRDFEGVSKCSHSGYEKKREHLGVILEA